MGGKSVASLDTVQTSETDAKLAAKMDEERRKREKLYRMKMNALQAMRDTEKAAALKSAGQNDAPFQPGQEELEPLIEEPGDDELAESRLEINRLTAQLNSEVQLRTALQYKLDIAQNELSKIKEALRNLSL